MPASTSFMLPANIEFSQELLCIRRGLLLPLIFQGNFQGSPARSRMVYPDMQEVRQSQWKAYFRSILLPVPTTVVWETNSL